MPDTIRTKVEAALLAVYQDRAARQVAADPAEHVAALADAVMPVLEHEVDDATGDVRRYAELMRGSISADRAEMAGDVLDILAGNLRSTR